MIRLFNCDNLEFMAKVPDKFYELAIVDPPYGGGQHFNFRFGVGDQVYENHKPDLAYFNEIRRVSVNQIIWGGNYFTDWLPPNRCWLSWSKNNPAPNFSDFELAWTSFDKVSKELRLDSYGFNHADKKQTGNPTIHPTQKPVALYKWLLKNYAKEGDKILDTHGGILSIAIACGEMGFDLDACELDGDYFKESVARVQRHFTQSNAFMKTPEILVNPMF